MPNDHLHNAIEEAIDVLPTLWPLYSFVTYNPLAGFEDKPFYEAIDQARKYFHASGYPSMSFFRQGWEKGYIDKAILDNLLAENNITLSYEECLKIMHQDPYDEGKPKESISTLDRQMVKWLSAFMDEGLSEWPLPGREKGFYQAWLDMGYYDYHIPHRKTLSNFTPDARQRISEVIEAYPKEQWFDIFTYQLTSLSGWTSYIKYREKASTEWQQNHPITLVDYLAVRVSLAQLMGIDLTPPPDYSSEAQGNENIKRAINIKKVWLQAWEYTYQQTLTDKLVQAANNTSPNQHTSDAQFVFCIDTRSEVIRRKIEETGAYETFGYAGFFGIPMQYQPYRSNVVKKSCPPIVESLFKVNEELKPGGAPQARRFYKMDNAYKTGQKLINTFKHNVPASFAFVEIAGIFYGLLMVLRTIIPRLFYKAARLIDRYLPTPADFARPVIRRLNNGRPAPIKKLPQLSTKEKAEIAKTAFELMGWSHFAPFVIFTGHGSASVNNPFYSSLDCGACAGSKGGINASVLAHICNEEEVRQILSNEHSIEIPDDTLFLAAQHNTTTDEIDIYDQSLDTSALSALEKIKNDLEKARFKANKERLGDTLSNEEKSDAEANRRAYDWSEVRPEWGLAGNASFIIGRRALTKRINLKGRSFLHAYDWKKDTDGKALAAIMQGPMVVTQWINNHYYFTTVDNNNLGSGSKVTQNIIGSFGVVQGNGGDLQGGLPLQSLLQDDKTLYHHPLRLSVFIQAPVQRVKSILANYEHTLGTLINNEWVYVVVIDPEQGNKVSYGTDIYNARTQSE